MKQDNQVILFFIICISLTILLAVSCQLEIQKDFEHKELYENGETKRIYFTKNGKKEGVEKWYYESGKILQKQSFKDGLEHGPYLKYFESGKPHLKGYYSNGYKSDLWKEMDSLGNLTKSIKWGSDKKGAFKYFQKDHKLEKRGIVNQEMKYDGYVINYENGNITGYINYSGLNVLTYKIPE